MANEEALELANEMSEYYDKLYVQSEAFVKTKPETMSLSVVNLMKMPIYRQAHNFTCGVACVQSALRYVGYDLDTREDKLLKILESTPTNGTNRAKIKEFLNNVTYSEDDSEEDSRIFNDLEWKSFNGGTYDREIAPFNELWETLSGEFAKSVICIIQAWGDPALYAAEENDDGHYVIAVGTAHDSDNKAYIIFMDPSTAGGYTYIERDEFMTRWHDWDGGKSNEALYYYGLVLNYKEKPKSEESIFYKLG